MLVVDFSRHGIYEFAYENDVASDFIYFVVNGDIPYYYRHNPNSRLYISVESSSGYADRILVDLSNIRIVDDGIIIKWVLDENATSGKLLRTQISYENADTTIIDHTEIVEISFGDSIVIDEKYIAVLYPSLFKEFRDLIENEKEERISADNELRLAIENIDVDISALENQIELETQSRISADQDLQAQINTKEEKLTFGAGLVRQDNNVNSLTTGGDFVVNIP